MSDDADGAGTGPVGERASRPARPPVPPRAPSAGPDDDGRHATERVPFPLPAPGSGQQPAESPRTEQVRAQPAGPPPPSPPPAGGRHVPPAPETGQLYLGEYPPRVPGAARPGAARPEAERRDEDRPRRGRHGERDPDPTADPS